MGRKRARSGGDAFCLDSSLEVVEEGGARCLVASSRARAPGSTPGFFNPKMVVNRDLVVAALAAAAAVRAPGLPPMRCLDAFCASGVLGLRWLAEVSAPLDVVLNDLSGRCAAMADENARAAAAAEDPSPQRVAAEPARASDDDARDVDPTRPTFPTRAFARSGSSARVTRHVADARLERLCDRWAARSGRRRALGALRHAVAERARMAEMTRRARATSVPKSANSTRACETFFHSQPAALFPDADTRVRERAP